MDDAELQQELEAMREFLGDDDEEETKEEPSWRPPPEEPETWGALPSFEPTEDEEASLAIVGRRYARRLPDNPLPELSAFELDTVRREFGRSPTPKTLALDDDLHSGFLPKPVGKVKSAKESGLYDDTEQEEPTRRPYVEDDGTPLTYKEFLARLMLPHSTELVAHVRAFVVRALEEARHADDAVRARQPQAVERRRKVLDGLPDRCAKFFSAAEAHLDQHPDWNKLGHQGLSTSRAALEKYVMTKLGAWAFESCRDDASDAELRKRCKALSTFLTPDMLDIKPGLCNEVVLHIARDELRRIDQAKAPADKVECVVRSASVIFSALNLSRAQSSSTTRVSESRAGADDFLPVFIYVVLGSDAPRLASNCNYVQAFHNPNALMSKAGYCFVNLRSAIDFLLHLQGDQIGIDQSVFDDRLNAALANLDDLDAAPSSSEDARP